MARVFVVVLQDFKIQDYLIISFEKFKRTRVMYFERCVLTVKTIQFYAYGPIRAEFNTVSPLAHERSGRVLAGIYNCLSA